MKALQSLRARLSPLLHSANFRIRTCGSWLVVAITVEQRIVNIVDFFGRGVIKLSHGCHRSGNGQGKKFFKVREMTGNCILDQGKLAF